jgi:hypothetical protein
MKIIDTESLKSEYIFHHIVKEGEDEFYFCDCGNKLTKNTTEGEEPMVEIDNLRDFDISEVYDNATKGASLVCDNCGKDYSKKEVHRNIIKTEMYFLERYFYFEDEQNLTIYKEKAIAGVNENASEIQFKVETTHIRLDKNSKILYYKPYNQNEREFNLDNVMSVVKKFFSNDATEITDNLIHVHIYIEALSRHIKDSNNINIVDELLSLMIGKSGLDILPKVVSIFYGILCYSNLSTIAITKGTVFLYDMLNECNLPNPKVLSDYGATSPIKIFSFLMNNKNEEIQAEIDSYDSEKQDFVYVSKTGAKLKIDFDHTRLERITGAISKGSDVRVREELAIKKVSPFIYNKIKTLSEYNTLIKYTKFISYEELIALVMNYDIELLKGLFPKIEFRDSVNMNQIKQFLSIAETYCARANSGNKLNSTISKKFIRSQFLEKEPEVDVNNEGVNDEEISTKVDYRILEYFDLSLYDDCIRMLNDLDWDLNREFYKLKTINSLEEYHDKLVNYYNHLADKEKTERFMNFVKKFEFLEEYDGDLSVQLIKAPEDLIAAAKDMKNCSASYISRISQESYIIAMVNDISSKRLDSEYKKYMLGLKVGKNGIEFDAVKAPCNKQGSDRFKTEVIKYLESKDISYRELSDLRLSFNTSSSNKGDSFIEEIFDI